MSLPNITTMEAWYILQTSAFTGGFVYDNGGASIIARGVCWNKSGNPTTSSYKTVQDGDTGAFVTNLTSLLPGTMYYVRAYATNKAGTGYGNQVTFETGAIRMPEIMTAEVSYINSTSAVSGGLISGDGGGSITSKGVCWSSGTDPTLESPHSTDGTGVETFVSHLTGLSGSTTYYVRAYAINSAGTAYGDALAFKTLSDSDAIIFYPIIFNPNLIYGTVRDADWNVYKTIQIGTQLWMAENLKTTSYNNQGQIPSVTDSTFWANTTGDAYCWYKNDTANRALYGALYNWYAVNSGNLCPSGWHVPGDDDWEILASYLGGKDVAGGKLKEEGTNHWLSPNTGASNESGFTALPSGSRGATGSFLNIRSQGSWWSSTTISIDSAVSRALKHDSGKFWGEDSGVREASVKRSGLSVRCVKDN